MLIWWLVMAAEQLSWNNSLPCNVPETIGEPKGFVMDPMGKIWLVDRDANLLVWDRQGALVFELGGRGQGPGEFNIKNQELIITRDAKNIIVCDSNRVSYFSFDGQFLRSVNKPAELQKRFKYFLRTPSGFLVAYNRYHGASAQGKLMNRVLLVDVNLSPRKVLLEERDWRWSKTPAGGWHSRPYAARLVLSVDEKGIWLARSDDNMVTSYGFDGIRRNSFRVKLPLAKVDLDDLENLRSSFFRGNRSANDTITFPEYDSQLDFMLPLEDDSMFVFQYQISTGLHRGVVVETKDGTVQKQIVTQLGENGRVMASQGKLLAISISDDGVYDIRRISQL